MILEVMYDAPNNTPHAEPDSEYVILYNNSCGDISLAGWELCDNAGCLTLEIGTLSQGTATAIIHSTDTAGLAAYDPNKQSERDKRAGRASAGDAARPWR